MSFFFDFIYEEIRKQAKEAKIDSNTARAIANIVKRARKKLYDEEKRKLNEKKVKELINSVLRKIPIGTPIKEAIKIIRQAVRLYEKWYDSHFSNKTPTRSELLSRFVIKDIYNYLSMHAKDYKTVTEGLKRKIRAGVFEAVVDHATLWKKRKKRRQKGG